MKRKYHSLRTGKVSPKFDIQILRELFWRLFQKFDGDSYFSKAFGTWSSEEDGGVHRMGTLGHNVSQEILLATRKPIPWPFYEYRIKALSEDDLFDLTEFLFDHVAKPIPESKKCDPEFSIVYYVEFNVGAGRQAWRREINQILKDYEDGFELSKTGEVLRTPSGGLKELLHAKLPNSASKDIEDRVASATLKFRRPKSTATDRESAVIELAGVLETLRPQLKKVMTRKDDGSIFTIANDFHLRHKDQGQLKDYDKDVCTTGYSIFTWRPSMPTFRMIEKGKSTP